MPSFQKVQLSKSGPDAISLQNAPRHTVSQTNQPTIACLSFVQENALNMRDKTRIEDGVFEIFYKWLKTRKNTLSSSGLTREFISQMPIKTRC